MRKFPRPILCSVLLREGEKKEQEKLGGEKQLGGIKGRCPPVLSDCTNYLLSVIHRGHQQVR